MPVSTLIHYSIVANVSNSGETMTFWSAKAPGSYLLNGMTYDNGFIEVPIEGLYHIYAQTDYKINPSSWSGSAIQVNGKNVVVDGFSQFGNYVNSKANYIAVYVYLDKGDRISVVARQKALYHLFKGGNAFVGAVRQSG